MGRRLSAGMGRTPSPLSRNRECPPEKEGPRCYGFHSQDVTRQPGRVISPAVLGAGSQGVTQAPVGPASPGTDTSLREGTLGQDWGF